MDDEVKQIYKKIINEGKSLLNESLKFEEDANTFRQISQLLKADNETLLVEIKHLEKLAIISHNVKKQKLHEEAQNVVLPLFHLQKVGQTPPLLLKMMKHNSI
jgi:uncharacterized protein (UPF0128 family)